MLENSNAWMPLAVTLPDCPGSVDNPCRKIRRLMAGQRRPPDRSEGPR
ncbi:MAG: hypothetical protein IPF73_02975 [Betaproteobacteria bacterium]|nr:hypothetical protein [Betaproteobacteria bacterium]